MVERQTEDEVTAEEQIRSGEADPNHIDEELVLSVRPLQRAPRPRGVLAE